MRLLAIALLTLLVPSVVCAQAPAANGDRSGIHGKSDAVGEVLYVSSLVRTAVKVVNGARLSQTAAKPAITKPSRLGWIQRHRVLVGALLGIGTGSALGAVSFDAEGSYSRGQLMMIGGGVLGGTGALGALLIE